MDTTPPSPDREREVSRRPRPGVDPLDQRLDRWVSAGRQFVDGVSGARPGSRGAERRGTGRAALDGLGQWVENRLDWLLEDGDDWREPWQEPEAREAGTGTAPRRRKLDAISRRGTNPPPVAGSESPRLDPDEWPEDDSFSLPRWQRPDQGPPQRPDPGPPQQPVGEDRSQPAAAPAPAASRRPLPRSSRRRR